MAELNPNAQKWVEALRSGRFTQGQRALTTVGLEGKEYDCCLGVACKVAIESGLNLKTFTKFKFLMGEHSAGGDHPEESRLVRVYGATENFGTLPHEVVEWLGLVHGDGQYTSEQVQNLLTTDNDEGKSFAEIAAIIESQPEGMFVAAVK